MVSVDEVARARVQAFIACSQGAIGFRAAADLLNLKLGQQKIVVFRAPGIDVMMELASCGAQDVLPKVERMDMAPFGFGCRIGVEGRLHVHIPIQVHVETELHVGRKFVVDNHGLACRQLLIFLMPRVKVGRPTVGRRGCGRGHPPALGHGAIVLLDESLSLT